MLRIDAIPAFTDNYIWCLQRDGRACVVDPGDAQPVEDFLRRHGLVLDTILITHHHADHCGGLAGLAHHGAAVHGAAVDGVGHPLDDGDSVRALGLDFEVLAVPGHTLDHLAFHAAESPLGPLLFCGDTLFAGGCGRLFEGTPEAMQRSLRRLAELPAQTAVYCAHEYTEANLAFARQVEPGNQALRERQQTVRALRERGEPSLPSTLALECATNPFLRWDQPEVVAAATTRAGTDALDPVEVFAEIRRWKDVA